MSITETTPTTTLSDIVSADATGDALRVPGREPITYEGLRRTVAEIAGGLAALGVVAGDRVGILSSTRPEWVLADLGALQAGAIVVPVYHTNSHQECAYVLAHSECTVVFVENAAQAAKIDRARDLLPMLEHVIVLDGDADGALTLDGLRALDGSPSPVTRLPDDPATIVYTSGTTGPPKGCPARDLLVLAAGTRARPADRLRLPGDRRDARVLERRPRTADR